MRKIWLITLNTLAEMRQQRIIWVALLMALVIGMVSLAPLLIFDQVRAAGQDAIAERMGTMIVYGMVQAWAAAAYVLAIMQSSTAVSSELRSKTIVSLLARPLERWQYLLGRLLGIQLMAFGVFFFGLLIGFATALWFGVPLSAMVVPKLAENAVAIVFGANVSFALGILLPSQVAVLGTLLLPHLATLTQALGNVGDETLTLVAKILYYIAPARMPPDLIGSAQAEALAPRYDLFLMVLAENLLYATAFLWIACWWFGRREIRLGTGD
ncbi:MAG TPA: ABC transporter permease subunit [Terriglobales bacterium]|nr:ABC transporter permease subunit [Terriglobales bacterium]